jgi:hypothetical protein
MDELDDFDEWERERRRIDLDAAREERRREGKDVDAEVPFGVVMKKLEDGEKLSPTEEESVKRLLKAAEPLMRYARERLDWVAEWERRLEDS